MRQAAAKMRSSLLWLAFCSFMIVSGLEEQQDSSVKGNFSFASYYESNMVLQAFPARSIVWGFASVADIGASVYMNLSNAFQLLQYKTFVKSGPAENVAVWQVTLDPVRNLHPFTLIAALKTYELIVLKNVLFGDVWFCSGQSNMKFTMNQIFNSSQEAEESEKFNQIRFFSIGQVQSSTPLIDISNIEIHWSVPNRENILPFSAVCWLYAKYIYQQRPVPIGLVESSWGGTEIEAWLSPESLKSCGIKQKRKAIYEPLNEDALKTSKGFSTNVHVMKNILLNRTKARNAESRWKKYTRLNFDETVRRFSYRKNMMHSSLWNAMVYPLLNMTIFGVLWYQGEANSVYNMNLYNCTLPALVNDWRKKWFLGTVGQTNVSFPIGIVQLGPTSEAQSIAGFADIRWHQTADLGYLPNKIMPYTFLAVAYDMADEVGRIHYRDKLTVARRLALSGMAVAYGQTGRKYTGPLISRFTIDRVNYLLKLEYDNGKHPIVVRSDQGFEICCQKDSKQLCSQSGNDWLPASLASWNNNSVTLSVKECHRQYLMGIRFAWRETPCSYKHAPVYSVENDLPAPPYIVRRLLFGPLFSVGEQHVHKQQKEQEWEEDKEDSTSKDQDTDKNLNDLKQEKYNRKMQLQTEHLSADEEEQGENEELASHSSDNEEPGVHASEKQEDGNHPKGNQQHGDHPSDDQEQEVHPTEGQK